MVQQTVAYCVTHVVNRMLLIVSFVKQKSNWGLNQQNRLKSVTVQRDFPLNTCCVRTYVCVFSHMRLVVCLYRVEKASAYLGVGSLTYYRFDGSRGEATCRKGHHLLLHLYHIWPAAVFLVAVRFSIRDRMTKNPIHPLWCK